MKFKTFQVLFFVFLVTSCLSNDELSGTNDEQNIISLWHLVKVEGGIAGVNDQFDLNTIIWFLNLESNMIEVENNNTDDTKQDGLNTGSYIFSIESAGDKDYILIEGIEYGNIYLDGPNILVINGNDKLFGEGADNFVYTFSQQFIVE